MGCQETFAPDNTSNTMFVPKNVVVGLPICIAIHLVHIALLMRVITKEGPIWKKPINWMILSDEVIRFLGSVGCIHATILEGLWQDPGAVGQLNSNRF